MVKINQKMSELSTSEDVINGIFVTASLHPPPPTIKAPSELNATEKNNNHNHNHVNRMPSMSPSAVSTPPRQLEENNDNDDHNHDRMPPTFPSINNNSTSSVLPPPPPAPNDSNQGSASMSPSSNNASLPSINAPPCMNSNDAYRKCTHNDVIDDSSLTHTEPISRVPYNCKGWIIKENKKDSPKRKLIEIICYYCPSEPPKLVDQNGLHRHLQAKHSTVPELKLTI